MALRVLIVGGGNTGTHLAGLLSDGGHQVTVVELKPDHARRLSEEVPRAQVVEGDGTDPDVLERAGVRAADVVAATTGADEVNLVVCSLARFEFRRPRTLARVHNPRNAWMFTAEMGVDVALNQADLLAHLIAEELSVGELTVLLKLRGGGYSLVAETIHPSAPAAGRALRELELPGCRLVAVFRGPCLHLPAPGLVLEPGDEVLALVPPSATAELSRLLGPPPQERV